MGGGSVVEDLIGRSEVSMRAARLRARDGIARRRFWWSRKERGEILTCVAPTAVTHGHEAGKLADRTG